MSDPNASFTSFVRGGIKRISVKKSRSEAERINGDMADGYHEVEAGTIHDELENGEEHLGFLGRAFGQAWHMFKERKRANSVALNAYLTYVTLPWYRIIADVLDVRQQPVLVF